MNSALPRADCLSWMRIVEYYSPPRSHREKKWILGRHGLSGGSNLKKRYNFD